MIRSWLQLVRPLNLFILAITQYFINEFFLIPHFKRYGILFSLNEFHFFLLVLSTIFICAAGYLINDYFDVQLDQINKPKKQIVGKAISKKAALNAYWFLSIIGFSIAIYLSWYIKFIQAATIQGISILLLYFYSASYKRIAILGNIIVAFLTSLSLLTVLVYEPHLFQLQRPADYYIAGFIWKVILIFSIFAFILTFIIEIIKDIEDMEGDRVHNVRSIPILWGIKSAKIFILVSSFFLILLIAFFGFGMNITFSIYTSLLILMLIVFNYLVLSATRKEAFHRLSVFAKCIMFFGVCFFPIHYFIYFYL